MPPDDDLTEVFGEMLAGTEVGDVVSEGSACHRLGIFVEGLFRSQVRYQWEGWPPEATTDGSSVHICIRRELDSVDAIGLTYFDFTSKLFPFRARLTERAAGAVSVVLSIGQVDEGTGRPPLLPANAVILAEQQPHGPPTPKLSAGRHQVPIVWTDVLVWPPPTP